MYIKNEREKKIIYPFCIYHIIAKLNTSEIIRSIYGNYVTLDRYNYRFLFEIKYIKLKKKKKLRCCLEQRKVQVMTFLKIVPEKTTVTC